MLREVGRGTNRERVGAPRGTPGHDVAGGRAPPGRALARRLLLAAGGLLVLGLLARHLGSGPFVEALRRVEVPLLAAAVGIGAVSTAASAWRWSATAAGLGVRLPVRDALRDYYRSTFLNAVLPGGVLGDVHRAARHGRELGDVGLAARAVVLERLAGQVVLVGATLGVVAVVGFTDPAALPWRPAPGLVLAAVAVVALGAFLLLRDRRPAGTVGGAGRWTPALVLAASVVALSGHVATFVLAARAAGAALPPAQLVPLALVALLAMSVPLNLAGWGPREGATAWAFAGVGLEPGQGLTVAVLYGVLAFAAGLPGAVVALLAARPQAGAKR
jgi:uncharacterized membrane protein YbhN (UPF0104 family)